MAKDGGHKTTSRPALRLIFGEQPQDGGAIPIPREQSGFRSSDGAMSAPFLKTTSAISPDVDRLFPLAVENGPGLLPVVAAKDATLGIFVMKLRA